MDYRAVLRIVDFFIPLEVVSSVLLIFVAENILESALGDIGLGGWLVVYIVGLVLVSALQYLSADEDEMEDLEEDLEEARNGRKT